MSANEKLKDHLHDQLFAAILELQNLEECYEFFEDICTIQEMKAIAACVLGGISLSGGLGSLLGASIGAVIMSSVSRILVFLGFSSDYDNTITGILLITIVVIDALTQNRAATKSRHERLAARTGPAQAKKGGAAK